MYGPLAPRALTLYDFAGGKTDPLYGSPAAQWVVDTMYRCPVVMQQTWHAESGSTAYEYQFDHAPPGREAIGATHGAELPYVFGIANPRWTDVDRNVSAAMQMYWINFAETGNPNGSSLPPWPRFTSESSGYIEFTDAGPIAHEGLRRPYCDVYVDNVKRLLAR
jgi:para-nitrobenzyl esterase